LVLGAGPAGVGAALAAAECGVETLIVDAAGSSGGQVYRAMPETFHTTAGALRTPDQMLGAEQRDALFESKVERAFGRKVWSVTPGFRADALGPEGLEHWRSRALVAATGTTERVVPFPGWTLPGVIGLGAATVLLKSQMVLPGSRTLVAGCGPLLVAVAAGILKAGGHVVAVLDLSGPGDWLRSAPAMAAQPSLVLRGLRWLGLIRAAGVPLLSRRTLREVRARGEHLEVIAAPVDAKRRLISGAAETIFKADCVAVGHGLVPATEVTRLLQARHAFQPERGGWIAHRDAHCRTTVERLFAAGDSAGISGAAAAYLEGRIAGLTAALDLGRIDAERHREMSTPIAGRLRKAARFGAAMARLMALRPGQVEGVDGDTVVCRCEDVTRAEIEAALDQGARQVNQLKSWTRCGMGPCQGRMCGEIAASLVAARVGGREKAGLWTARAPIRPIDLEALSGDLAYEDIPIPQEAPL
jgi:thioredoxin reductase/bacterioferritin-associated ferredoxin